MDIAHLAAEILARARSLPTPNTAGLRSLRKEYSRRLGDAGSTLVIALALELSAGGLHRFFGDELIANHPGGMSLLGPEEVLALGHGISSWDQVDCFALYLAGPAWRRHQIGDGLVLSWTASPDRWWRRAALVATVALNSSARGGSGDSHRTLQVCGRLVADRDDMVVKALSWALRALVPVDADGVRGFLAAHRPELARRVIREVDNKLATGRKARPTEMPSSGRVSRRTSGRHLIRYD